MSQTFAALTISGHLTLPSVLVLSTLAATSGAFDLPTRNSMNVRLVPPHYLASAMGLYLTTFNGASLVGPGHVHHHGFELLRLGERQGPVTARTERIADVWRQGGFNVRTYDDVEQLIWEKLICNACFSGPCGLLELTVGEVIGNAHAWSIASRCAEEAIQVARASGVTLAIDDCASYVREFGLTVAGARPSVLLDLLAGRPCEIEWINGAIPDQAQRVGLSAPTNELITTLVLAKQAARAASHE